MPLIREMHYDVPAGKKPKIRYRWRWWPNWLVRRWIKKAIPMTGLPDNIEGYFRVRKK